MLAARTRYKRKRHELGTFCHIPAGTAPQPHGSYRIERKYFGHAITLDCYSWNALFVVQI
jgi:hypothetical protein